MVVRKLLHIKDKKKDDHTADAVEHDFDNTECDTEGFIFVHCFSFRFRFRLVF